MSVTPPSPPDRLYQTDTVPEDFAFSERVVEVFDDMLDRSIPFYQEVIKATARLLKRYLQPGDTICDLGCSTGSSLLQLARLLEGQELHLVGIDNSPAMLEKARCKAALFDRDKQMHFILEDITRLQRPGTGAFICNYTLQFIRPIRRPALIDTLFTNLRPGGVLIVSEKTVLPESALNRGFIDIYHDFKRERGYSELEIARKREALENILIPFSIEENISLLQDVGFTPVTPFFQWFNFSSFIACKPS